MTYERDYDRAYRLNQHPALKSKDRITALWYVSDERFAAALAEMEAAVIASGIPLDLAAIEHEAILNRLGSLQWELDNPQRRHERERREELLAEKRGLEAALAASPVNLLDATRAAGLRPNLNTVTDLLCAAVASSTSLDAVGERGTMQAAE